MPKGMSLDKVMSNSEKTKPVALVVIELRLSESIKQAGRQAISQSVKNSIKQVFKNICSSLLGAFKVILNACTFVIPNQYYQGARMVF